MSYKWLRKDIKKASNKIYRGALKIGKATVKREVKRVKASRKMKYPDNLGLYKKDVNHLVDF